MTIRIYGLETCDTCRKAKKFFESKGLEVVLVDVRAKPLTRAKIVQLLDEFGDRLLNTRSATWRRLSEVEKALALPELIESYPALMKRPLIESAAGRTLGWNASVESTHVGGARPRP